jgi:KDO2-lipid IV(A) lauroyltransferase
MPPQKKRRKIFRPRRLVRSTLAALVWLRYRAAEYSLRSFVRVLPWLPARFLSALSSAIARGSFLILWKYRRRMEENLGAAMAKEFSSAGQRKALIRKAWRNFAQSALETSYLMKGPKEKVLASVAIEGEEHLKRALVKGKGVIALSAHLGNFTMIGIRLGAAGYPMTALIKQPRDPRFARLMDGYRTGAGLVTISAKPRREAVRKVLRALRVGSVVLIIADEFKSAGVPVEFFGVRSPAPRGPATLALRTRAATVPMFATRDADDRMTLHIEPEIELIKTGNREQDVAANTELFTRHLEGMIRRYPDQWNWLGFRREGIRPRGRKVKGFQDSGVEEL